MFKNIQSGTAFDAVKSTPAPKANSPESARNGATFQNYYSASEKHQGAVGATVQSESGRASDTEKIGATDATPSELSSGAVGQSKPKLGEGLDESEGVDAIQLDVVESELPLLPSDALSKEGGVGTTAMPNGTGEETNSDVVGSALGAATPTPEADRMGSEAKNAGTRSEQPASGETVRRTAHRSIAEMRMTATQSNTAMAQQSNTAMAQQSNTAMAQQSNTAMAQQSDTAMAQQSNTVMAQQTNTALPPQSNTALPQQLVQSNASESAELVLGQNQSLSPSTDTKVSNQAAEIGQNTQAASGNAASAVIGSQSFPQNDQGNKSRKAEPTQIDFQPKLQAGQSTGTSLDGALQRMMEPVREGQAASRPAAETVSVNAGAQPTRHAAASAPVIVSQTVSTTATIAAGQIGVSDAEALLDPMLSEPAGLSQLLTEAVMSPGTTHRPETPRLVAVQLAEALATKGERNIDVALNPEELGRVKMRVTTTDTSVIVMITTERPETGDLMRRHINELAEEFRRMGFEDISFEFSGEGMSGQMGEGGEQGDSPNSESSEASDSGVVADNMPKPAQQNLRLGETGLDMRI